MTDTPITANADAYRATYVAAYADARANADAYRATYVAAK